MIYVVGHRGAAGVLPENTIQGFQYAIDLGVDYVECDVHLTRNQQLVVMHDETVDRTTSGSGPIGELDFAAIRALDAGADTQVPTLDEVLETVRGKVKLLCELKGQGVEEKTVDTVESHGLEAQVIFTSFHMERLERVRKRGAHFRLGATFADPREEDITSALELRPTAVGIYYKNLCLHLVEQVLDAGLELHAWNPDTLREQQAMIALGVTGVSTNRPDILMEYLQSNREI